MTLNATETHPGDALPPHIPGSMWRTYAYDAVERIAEQENDEAITEEQANADLDLALFYRLDLTREDRDAAYEQLREALKKLEHIRSDMFDPEDGDRDYLEALADSDVENARRKLIGPRR